MDVHLNAQLKLVTLAQAAHQTMLTLATKSAKMESTLVSDTHAMMVTQSMAMDAALCAKLKLDTHAQDH